VPFNPLVAALDLPRRLRILSSVPGRSGTAWGELSTASRWTKKSITDNGKDLPQCPWDSLEDQKGLTMDKRSSLAGGKDFPECSRHSSEGGKGSTLDKKASTEGKKDFPE
jgi:hypothetical protein